MDNHVAVTLWIPLGQRRRKSGLYSYWFSRYTLTSSLTKESPSGISVSPICRTCKMLSDLNRSIESVSDGNDHTDGHPVQRPFYLQIMGRFFLFLGMAPHS